MKDDGLTVFVLQRPPMRHLKGRTMSDKDIQWQEDNQNLVNPSGA